MSVPRHSQGSPSSPSYSRGKVLPWGLVAGSESHTRAPCGVRVLLSAIITCSGWD